LEPYELFFTASGKATPLFFAFADGAEFFWGETVTGLEIKSNRIPNPEGQDKFDQILEWAKEQVKK
jgi:hypothetical protein